MCTRCKTDDARMMNNEHPSLQYLAHVWLVWNSSFAVDTRERPMMMNSDTSSQFPVYNSTRLTRLTPLGFGKNLQERWWTTGERPHYLVLIIYSHKKLSMNSDTSSQFPVYNSTRLTRLAPLGLGFGKNLQERWWTRVNDHIIWFS